MNTVESSQRVAIRAMTHDDIAEVLSLLRDIAEVACCDWENEELFRNELRSDHSVLLVALVDKRIIGTLIGGNFARRGTICHTAVDPNFRSLGVGSLLVKECLSIFRNRAVQRVHLMVTPDNDGAERFWQRHGFVEDPTRQFIEFDVPEEFRIGDEAAALEVFEVQSASDVCDCMNHFDRDEWREPAVVSEAITGPACIVLKANSATADVLAGGSFGFRAEVSIISASNAISLVRLIYEACLRFAKAGIRRIHFQFSPEQRTLMKQLVEFGFRVNEGEKLFHLELA